MVAEFTRMAVDLDREIANEEKRAGISDPNHFAYPTYARAAITRRDNLKRSIGELTAQIEEAKTAQEEAQAELLKYESLEGREKAIERARRIRRQSSEPQPIAPDRRVRRAASRGSPRPAILRCDETADA